jgi:hypothetical protein
MTCNSAEFIAELRQMVEQANNAAEPLQRNRGSLDIHRPPGRVVFGVSAYQGGCMPNRDFVAKLNQIEEQANAAIAELPAGMPKTRIQHIVVLAKTLRGRLEFGTVAVVRIGPDAAAPGESTPA